MSDGFLVSCVSGHLSEASIPKSLEEAWALIDDAVEGDCGPYGEQWCSEELREALEMFRQLYAPHTTAKALFPNSPSLWPKSQRHV